MCLLDVNVHVNYYFTTHEEIKKNIFIKKNVSFWTQRDCERETATAKSSSHRTATLWSATCVALVTKVKLNTLMVSLQLLHRDSDYQHRLFSTVCLLSAWLTAFVYSSVFSVLKRVLDSINCSTRTLKIILGLLPECKMYCARLDHICASPIWLKHEHNHEQLNRELKSYFQHTCLCRPAVCICGWTLRLGKPTLILCSPKRKCSSRVHRSFAHWGPTM